MLLMAASRPTNANGNRQGPSACQHSFAEIEYGFSLYLEQLVYLDGEPAVTQFQPAGVGKWIRIAVVAVDHEEFTARRPLPAKAEVGAERIGIGVVLNETTQVHAWRQRVGDAKT